jgi:hypothetical protein
MALTSMYDYALTQHAAVRTDHSESQDQNRTRIWLVEATEQYVTHDSDQKILPALPSLSAPVMPLTWSCSYIWVNLWRCKSITGVVGYSQSGISIHFRDVIMTAGR